MLALLRQWFGFADHPRTTRELGRAGEQCAARFLKRAGYRIIDRNVNTPIGEADLISLAPDGRTIVFVEVKTRRIHNEQPLRYAPELAIDARKSDVMPKVARLIAARRGWKDHPIRIDVIAIEWHRSGRDRDHAIRHHLNV